MPISNYWIFSYTCRFVGLSTCEIRFRKFKWLHFIFYIIPIAPQTSPARIKMVGGSKLGRLPQPPSAGKKTACSCNRKLAQKSTCRKTQWRPKQTLSSLTYYHLEISVITNPTLSEFWADNVGAKFGCFVRGNSMNFFSIYLLWN